MAPPRYVLGDRPEAAALRRNLVWAVVPFVADHGLGFTWKRTGFELVRKVRNTMAGGVVVQGEACGPALYSVTAALGFFTAPNISRLPDQPPLTVFAFIVNRGSTAIQVLFGHRLGGSGWSMALSYGSGQLGITRWGVADHPTSGMVVPTGGAHSCVGVSWASGTARFFVNGKFENLSIASPITAAATDQLFADGQSGFATENCACYVAYAWDRALSDAEIMRLHQDPFVLVRPSLSP